MKDSKESPLFRKANFDDVSFITHLVKEFYEKREHVYKIPYDHESMLITVDETIRSGICLVGPNSCAGAFLNVYPGNCNYVVASVKFWYFRRPREIEIFYALCEECRRHGANMIDSSAHSPDNTIGRFYERLGMYPAETVYLGSLENCCKPRGKAVKPET